MPTLADLQDELAYRLMDPNHARWTVAQLQRFLAAGIEHANLAGARRFEKDESLTVVSQAVEYDLTDLLSTATNPQVFRVSVEGETNQPWAIYHSWDVTGYVHEGVGIVWTLLLQKAFPETEGKKIRVEYMAEHEVPEVDSDMSYLPGVYLVAYAMFRAYKETRAIADVDRKYYAAEATAALEEAEAELERVKSSQPNVGGMVIGQIL